MNENNIRRAKQLARELASKGEALVQKVETAVVEEVKKVEEAVEAAVEKAVEAVETAVGVETKKQRKAREYAEREAAVKPAEEAAATEEPKSE